MSEVRYFYRMGALVRVRSVDMYGMCGRDLHPEERDNGSVGYVISPTVRMVIDDGENTEPCDLYLVALLPHSNAFPYDERKDGWQQPNLGYLKTLLNGGRVLEFADYELEPA